MANLIDGKAVAAEIRAGLREQVDRMKEHGVTPCLAVLLAGEDPASQIYVRNKRRACREIGIESRVVKLAETASEDEILEAVRALNADPGVDAILVQMPLPKGVNEHRVLDEISADKDADGFHVLNAGRLFTGREAPLPCTPAGCMELLKRANVPLSGARAVVVGRSNIVGKPVAMLLLNENASVSICHSRTKDLRVYTKDADIIVLAAGRRGILTGEMLKPGAAIIDVGINRDSEGKVRGDADFASCEPIAGWITPVPGGVGPMTIAMLMKNAVALAEKRL